MSEMFSRRSFLKISGALVAASALAACSGGGGSTGSGSDDPSGGNSGIDTTKWYDVGNGVQMRGSVSASFTKPKNSPYYPYLSITFRNNTSNALKIEKNQFSNLKVDGENASIYALNLVKGMFYQTVTIDANSEGSVHLYLSKPYESQDESQHTVSFDYSYDSTKKVHCSGFYYQSNFTSGLFTIT